MRMFWIVFLLSGAGVHGVPISAGNNNNNSNNNNNGKPMDYTVEVCASRGSSVNVQHHPKNGYVDFRGNTYIFLDQEISCNGRISQWEYYVTHPGVFYAALLRPHMDSKTVMFVGANMIPVQTYDQIQIAEIPPHERLYAEVNDVVGLVFDADQFGDAYNTMVPVERSDLPRHPDNSDILGQVYVIEGLTYEGIEKGKVYPLNDALSDVGMSVALKATVKSITRMMRFTYSDFEEKPGEGRAELFKHGIWGTICDKWFHQLGWPYLFCREMGYPDPYFTYYTSSDRRHKADKDKPVHVKNPRCKPSQNISFLNCDLHENQDCEDHAYDLYIICRKRVELRFGAVPESEGIAFLYDEGYWGTICDIESPDDIDIHIVNGVLKKNLANHWCTAFCHELGFTACDDVYYADFLKTVNPGVAAHLTKYPTTSQTPRCEIADATSMFQCMPSPEYQPCNHAHDYYVVCHTQHGY